jgi:hypothetical protein
MEDKSVASNLVPQSAFVRVGACGLQTKILHASAACRSDFEVRKRFFKLLDKRGWERTRLVSAWLLGLFKGLRPFFMGRDEPRQRSEVAGSAAC